MGKTLRGMGGHQSALADSEIWLTPKPFLDSLGIFDLDPCAAPEPRPWSTATEMWSSNGLLKPWHGRVWCNPPYGNKVADWLEKLSAHGNGTALIFARTETDAWWEHVWTASAIMFLRTRIVFCRQDGRPAANNSGAPSALVAYGQKNVGALVHSGLRGVIVEDWTRQEPHASVGTLGAPLSQVKQIIDLQS